MWPSIRAVCTVHVTRHTHMCTVHVTRHIHALCTIHVTKHVQSVYRSCDPAYKQTSTWNDKWPDQIYSSHPANSTPPKWPAWSKNCHPLSTPSRSTVTTPARAWTWKKMVALYLCRSLLLRRVCHVHASTNEAELQSGGLSVHSSVRGWSIYSSVRGQSLNDSLLVRQVLKVVSDHKDRHDWTKLCTDM